MLRLPQRLVDLAAATCYEIDNFGNSLEIRVAGDYVVFDFHRDEEEGGGRWIEDVESEAWLPALLPLRAELAAGDWRCLYLGWLAAIGSGLLADEEEEEEIAEDEEEIEDVEERFEDDEEEDDNRVEPPVPPGLKNLSAPQQTLAGNARPGNIFAGVVNPTVGYGIKGVIWYQGESNASRAWEYAQLFPFMIEQWRKEWKQRNCGSHRRKP